MNKVIFTRDEMREMDVPYVAVHDEITDTSRWSEHHWCVFEKDGKHYGCSYSCGATEYQDESPFEYDSEIECVEVELKEVTVKKWVPVEGEEDAVENS